MGRLSPARPLKPLRPLDATQLIQDTEGKSPSMTRPTLSARSSSERTPALRGGVKGRAAQGVIQGLDFLLVTPFLFIHHLQQLRENKGSGTGKRVVRVSVLQGRRTPGYSCTLTRDGSALNCRAELPRGAWGIPSPPGLLGGRHCSKLSVSPLRPPPAIFSTASGTTHGPDQQGPPEHVVMAA